MEQATCSQSSAQATAGGTPHSPRHIHTPARPACPPSAFPPPVALGLVAVPAWNWGPLLPPFAYLPALISGVPGLCEIMGVLVERSDRLSNPVLGGEGCFYLVGGGWGWRGWHLQGTRTRQGGLGARPLPGHGAPTPAPLSGQQRSGARAGGPPEIGARGGCVRAGSCLAVPPAPRGWRRMLPGGPAAPPSACCCWWP